MLPKYICYPSEPKITSWTVTPSSMWIGFFLPHTLHFIFQFYAKVVIIKQPYRRTSLTDEEPILLRGVLPQFCRII